MDMEEVYDVELDSTSAELAADIIILFFLVLFFEVCFEIFVER